MSGAWLFWIIVEDCWSMLSQLTTWTSRVLPVFSLYVLANESQNALVWSLEYSAATSLIVVGPPLLPPEALPPPADPAPVPPPHAPRARPAMAIPATTTDFFVDLMSLPWFGAGTAGVEVRRRPGDTVTPNLDRRPRPFKSNDDRMFINSITNTHRVGA